LERSIDCPFIWVCVYVLPNKVAPRTATAVMVKSILRRLFITQRDYGFLYNNSHYS